MEQSLGRALLPAPKPGRDYVVNKFDLCFRESRQSIACEATRREIFVQFPASRCFRGNKARYFPA